MGPIKTFAAAHAGAPQPSRSGSRAVRAVAVSAALAVAMTATAPALAQSTAYASRKVGETTSFDIEIPAKLLAAISDSSKPCYNTVESSVVSGGKTYAVRTTEISWDKNLTIGKGHFAFSSNGGYGANCWQSFETTDADWGEFETKLQTMAIANQWGSSRVVLSYRTGQKGEPTLTLSDREMTTLGFKPTPLPETLLPGESQAGLKARQAIVTAMNTVVPNTIFPDGAVLIPADLTAVREAMLRYGNIERSNPKFRPGIPAALPVVKGEKFTLGGTQFDVVDQGDLTLNEKLNTTAQWFAEALAAGQGSAHTFSGTWTVDGKPVAMREFGQRGEYFGTGPLAGEVSGSGGAGSFPYGWMQSNTHLAWWFGVGGPYKEVGFGAARDKMGSWHFVGLANK